MIYNPLSYYFCIIHFHTKHYNMQYSVLFNRLQSSYFTHPANVCMTYFQHFWFSMSLCKKFAAGSIKAFIHAIHPDLYITSSSDLLEDVKADMKTVGCSQHEL
jgi:hypothetical protein